MLTIGLVFLLISCILANPVNDTKADNVIEKTYDSFRLSSTQIPNKYKIDLILEKSIFDGETSVFDGIVEITFKVTEAISSIQLHAPMKIKSATFTSTTDVVVKNQSLNETTSILNLILGAALQIKKDYTLKIAYTGDIDLKTMRGLYRSSYVDKDNVNQYLLTTQFQPTYARQAFPCFDEPSYKATFIISLTYPKGLNVFGNTQLDGNPVTVDTDYEKATFKETPKMSTYLVAFIISKFTCSDGKEIESGVPHYVCSRNETNDQRSLPVKYSATILNALADFTEIKYSAHLKKMTEVALPDFNAGAMENWGLVTYREVLLLFDEKKSANIFKQNILTTIAHEFAHQWFGDYVTCDWWNNIFLNEGFATYFQFFIFIQIPEFASFELDKQFIILQQQKAFVVDGESSSKAITALATTPDEISSKFDIIAYNKAGSIIRMMENILTTSKFKTGIQNYLKSNKFSNAAPEHLLSALEKQASAENLPATIKFSSLMDSWLNEPGYPVITVKNEGYNLILEQKRFLYDSANANSRLTNWNIPISYTVETDTDKFKSVAPKTWLIEKNLTIEQFFTNSSSWIILNNQGSAFYRVNYEEELWNRIRTALLNDHKQIHVLNRAQIADDSLNLARAGILEYSKAFTILDYLVYETDYYPWMSALTSINYLLIRVGENTVLGTALKSKLLKILDEVIKSVNYKNEVDEEQIYALKKNLVLTNACQLGHKDCIAEAVAQFKSMRSNNIEINKNLKNVVYCNGLRHSSDAEGDWKFLWEKYQQSQLSTEQITILNALGCTKNVDLLKKYLDYSVNPESGIRYQDFNTVWSSVLNSNPEGVQAVYEYLTKDHQKIINYYSGASSIILNVAAVLHSDEQLNLLKKFLSSNDVNDAYKKAGEVGIKTVNANLKWLESKRKDLEMYLSVTPSKASSLTSFTYTILVCFSVLKYFLL